MITTTWDPRVAPITTGGHTSGHRTYVRGRGRLVRRAPGPRRVMDEPSKEDLEKELARGRAANQSGAVLASRSSSALCRSGKWVVCTGSRSP